MTARLLAPLDYCLRRWDKRAAQATIAAVWLAWIIAASLLPTIPPFCFLVILGLSVVGYWRLADLIHERNRQLHPDYAFESDDLGEVLELCKEAARGKRTSVSIDSRPGGMWTGSVWETKP